MRIASCASLFGWLGGHGLVFVWIGIETDITIHTIPPHTKRYLHTGDMRYCEAMQSYPALAGRRIDTVYLDTYVFPLNRLGILETSPYKQKQCIVAWGVIINLIPRTHK